MAAVLLGGCLAEQEEAAALVGDSTWTNLTSTAGAIATNCQSCHGATPSSGASVALTTSNYAAVVAATDVLGTGFDMVEAGTSADSFIYMVCVDDSRLTNSLTLMPGGAAAADAIAAWIDAGAPE